MGGAQYFWRVTLLEGKGRSGIYQLGKHSLARGQQRPTEIPYRVGGHRLSYEQLLDEIHDTRTGLGAKALTLTPEKPQVELYYDWYMAI